MQIITLTSDWKENDYYVASLKGKLLTHCPQAQIVDISHRVKVFNTAEAAFLVRNSYPHFPEGTIHIIAVNAEPVKDGQLLAARMAGHYFLCADNGMLGLLGGPGPEQVVQISETEEKGSLSFISMSVFAEVASKLAGGAALDRVGKMTDSYDRQVPLRPTIDGSTIIGRVIHIDSYENAITNISREVFDRVGKGRPFRVLVQGRHNMVEKINRRYHETVPGELLAIFNALELLEIAIRNGNAAGLLNLTTSSTVRVEFNEG